MKARGAASEHWIGDSATYGAFHKRVKAARGAPSACEQCGTSDPSKTYDWANLTGNYQDVNDYARMCRSCHRGYDIGRGGTLGPNGRKTACPRGHPYDVSIVCPNGRPGRACSICSRALNLVRARRYRESKRALLASVKATGVVPSGTDVTRGERLQVS
jgi:hypothetical protein